MDDFDRLHLDFETFSECELKLEGVSRYARNDTTEVLLLAWAVNDDKVKLIDFTAGETMPPKLLAALRDPEVKKCAWNVPFEYNIFCHTLGIEIPFEEWFDAMVLAHTCSFPGALDKVGKILQMDDGKQKLARGKALIKKFCTPRKPTKKLPHTRANRFTDPEDWEEFKEYCRRDVEAERAIYHKLKRYGPPKHEWELWCLDQKINNRGIPINMRVVRNAIKVADEVVTKRLAEMRLITGLSNPNSGAQLLPWLRTAGYRFTDLKAGHVKTALGEAKGDVELERVLSLRQEVSKASVKKYTALAWATDVDGFLRNVFQFAGAQRTWRWAGRRYQPQNLARPVWYLEEVESQSAAVRDLEFLDTEQIEWLYEKPMDLLSTCVRPVVQPIPGYILNGADLNAIENRVLGWLADDQKILDVFRHNRDPYVDFATYMYKEKYEDLYHDYKVNKNKKKRNLAKPGVLGCGYMLSAGAVKVNKATGETEATGLLGYAWNMGVKDMTLHESTLAVKVFRETFTEVVGFWYDLDKAVRRCIKTGNPQTVGFIEFDIAGPFMRMLLPSGRNLHYYKPRIEIHKTPWGVERPTITYEGLNDKGNWGRITTHPGKITENAVQAVARDVLAHGMTLADKKGLDIRLHVHDEIVTMGRKEKAASDLKILIESMSVVPDWAPGLLLSAEGESSHAFFKT